MGEKNEDWDNEDPNLNMSGSDVETSDDEEEEEDEENYFEADSTNDNNKRRLNVEGQDGKKAKSARTESTKQPNMDELKTLKETQMLYHSNLFRMQMEEVLGEVSIKDKTCWQLQDWLTRFSTFLTALPKSKEYALNDNKWMEEHGVCDPAVEILHTVEGKFLFAPPTKVEFVGSFGTNTLTKLNKSVDVTVTLPKECVHPNDWRDGRWLNRRIKYSAWIACCLQDQTDLVTSLNWTKQFGLATRPVLQISPGGKLGKTWKVNIFPVPPPEFIKLSQFSPLRWNIQPKWFFNKNPDQVKKETATPHYNWACGVDMVMLQHVQLIKSLLAHQTNLIQGIKLIKIWLAQRQLDRGAGCFSGHMVSLLVIHLLKSRKINPQMSAYQIFRSVMVAFHTADWSVAGLNMGTSSQAEGPTTEEFHQHYDVVFVDPSGMINVATSLTTADYLRMKYEAGLAITFLDSASDCFDSLYIKKVENFHFSDQILVVMLSPKCTKKAIKQIKDYNDKSLDALGVKEDVIFPSILKVLREGLGERAFLVAPLRSPPDTWAINQSYTYRRNLEVGFILNPDTAWALLTKGPSSDSPEAEQFKKFWGDKCSLRRFQDGSFHEAVLWGDPKLSTAERRLIPEQICKELLKQHFGIWKSPVSFVNKQTEVFLHHDFYTLKHQYATGEEATVSAIQAFDTLSRKLRSLDLPLKVSAVQSTSDVNRHARVFPPVAKSLCNYGKIIKVVDDDHLEFKDDITHCRNFEYAVEVIVLLEISGKWPDDVTAIQAVKAEFHSKMADLLKQDDITVQLFPEFLQILWEGYIFRVRVSYLREIYLRRLIETPEGHYKEQDNPDALRYEKYVDILPKYTSSLASIQSEHPSFNGGLRLCKRWVGSQLLLHHLPHAAVELLVAHLYLMPAPYSPPHTPHVTLLRFLSLLMHTDWKTTPILVNLSEAFTDEDVAELHRRFTSQRSILPHMFIATPHELRNIPVSEDPTRLDQRYKLASFWTKGAPSPQILYRAKQLASAALEYLNANLLNRFLDVKVVFRPSMKDYDVVIKLRSSQLSRGNENMNFNMTYKLKPYKKNADEVMPIVMFDAVYFYLKELRETYGHFALFFHDEHGGMHVGVVWKPTALVPQDLKITSLEGHQVSGIKKLTQAPNMNAIISDFYTLGEGLVESVTIGSKVEAGHTRLKNKNNNNI